MGTAKSFQRSPRRNFCGLSGSFPIRSIRSRSTAVTARPTRCRARGHAPDARTSQLSNRDMTRLVMVDGTTPTRDGAGARSMRPSRSCPRARCATRQRMHFDALTLLAVFIQHGDRKPEQQRLECRGALDPQRGRHASTRGKATATASVFFERPDSSACTQPVIALQDIGATFGGAGRTSKSSAKMNLKAWTNRPVFKPAKTSAAGEVPECRGNLTVSMAAGEGGRGDPRIGEAGRAFLQDRLLLFDRRPRARAHGDCPRRKARRIAYVAGSAAPALRMPAWTRGSPPSRTRCGRSPSGAARRNDGRSPGLSSLQLDTPRTSPAELRAHQPDAASQSR